MRHARPAYLPLAALTVLLLGGSACGGGPGQEDAADRSAAEETAAAEQAAPAGSAAARTTDRVAERPGAADGERAASDDPAPDAPRPRQDDAAEPSEETTPPEEAAPAGESTTRTVPAGTQLWLALRDSLDSETAAVGDDFTAEVTSPVTDGAYVLVPSGASAYGHVTRVRPARGDSAAVIAVAFDSVRVREEALPIAATVTDVKLQSRSEMKGEGKKIGIGAAAGAVVGAVVGKDVKGALIGAAGGAAAGTAVALGTQARYAVIPAGSEVTLRLDEPVAVRIPR